MNKPDSMAFIKSQIRDTLDISGEFAYTEEDDQSYKSSKKK